MLIIFIECLNLPRVGARANLNYVCFGFILFETLNIFIDIINNHNLEQLVHSPTRQNHVLDLVFASTPSLIKELGTAPGMSDHEIISFSSNCKHLSINKKAPCRVYLYHKGDIPSLKSELQEFQETFSTSDPLQNSVEHIIGSY